MATEKSENQQNLCKNNTPAEITTNSDTDFVRNDAEADDENQIKKSDGGEVDADSDEEDTMKCASDEEEEDIVKEVGEKLEKCLIEDKLNSQELNAEHGNLESEENNVPEDMTVKGETVDDNDSTLQLNIL
jgi:ABC-type proline/glycine betaine transport system ATPase subunit